MPSRFYGMALFETGYAMKIPGLQNLSFLSIIFHETKNTASFFLEPKQDLNNN
jgi:hypothetical protein